jgi:hypothetical protein
MSPGDDDCKLAPVSMANTLLKFGHYYALNSIIFVICQMWLYLSEVDASTCQCKNSPPFCQTNHPEFFSFHLKFKALAYSQVKRLMQAYKPLISFFKRLCWITITGRLNSQRGKKLPNMEEKIQREIDECFYSFPCNFLPQPISHKLVTLTWFKLFIEEKRQAKFHSLSLLILFSAKIIEILFLFYSFRTPELHVRNN